MWPCCLAQCRVALFVALAVFAFFSAAFTTAFSAAFFAAFFAARVWLGLFDGRAIVIVWCFSVVVVCFFCFCFY